MSAPPGARFSALDPLLAPRSVAILGASNDPRRIGGRPIALHAGAEIRGRDLPGQSQPARSAGPEGLSLGRRPAGDPGRRHRRRARRPGDRRRSRTSARAASRRRRRVHRRLRRSRRERARPRRPHGGAARSHGMRLLGPNCLGVFDARIGYYATFSSSFDSGWPVPGRIGIASQSGAYGTHLLRCARNRGIGALAVHHDRQRGRRDGRRMHRLAGGEPRDRRHRGLCRGHPRGARPDRRARAGACRDEADRDA